MSPNRRVQNDWSKQNSSKRLLKKTGPNRWGQQDWSKQMGPN